MDPQHAPTDPNLPVPIGFVLEARSLDDLDRELEQAGFSPGERAQVLEHIRRTEAQRQDRDNRTDQAKVRADGVAYLIAGCAAIRSSHGDWLPLSIR